MLSKKMQGAFNQQVNAELYSSYLYLAMVAYFESCDLKGCASWMRGQVQEELLHGMMIYDYVIERGGRVELGTIEAPTKTWDSPIAAFEDTYSHEQKVTGLINQLMDLAVSESDHASQVFLQWFVAEQVEEEATTSGILNKLKLAGSAGGGLFMIDNELGQRVFTPPTQKNG